MSAKDFKFVSPGIHVEEIDNSQRPRDPVGDGPLIIGRTRRGPAFQPVRVDSFSEFVTIFGNPVAGEEASDVWRSGIPTAPTFAAYAAQAWLKNSSPVTIMRLLGDQSPDQDSSTYAKAGWKSADTSHAIGGGAFGLFMFNSGSGDGHDGTTSAVPEAVDGALAAVFYTTSGIIALSGAFRGTGIPGTLEYPHDVGTTTKAGLAVAFGTSSATMYWGRSKGFDAQYTSGNSPSEDGSTGVSERVRFNFDRGSKNYIRKVFNTNPTLTNSNLVDTTNETQKNYWLGQSYEQWVDTVVTSSHAYGVILQLGRASTDMTNGGDFQFATRKASTGWFFSQDLRATPAVGGVTYAQLSPNRLSPPFNPQDTSTVTRLFKLHGLSSGEEIHRNYKISIEDLRYSKNDNIPYGTFTLAIRDIKDSDNARRYVEKYTNLSLDPNSPNYIAKQIGDRYYEWDDDARRLIEYGSFPNVSKVVRVEMANGVDANQHDPECLPFGFEGPLKYNDFEIRSISDEDDDEHATRGVLVQAGAAFTATTAPDSPVTAGSGSNGIYQGPTGSAFASANGVLLGALNNEALSFFTGSVKFPEIALRLSGTDGDLSDPTEAYFGFRTSRTAASPQVFDESVYDMLYPLPQGITATGDDIKTSVYFTLDDLMLKEGSKNLVFYFSGSRANGDSISARSGSYKHVLDKGYDRFTAPMFGGWNGFDVTEAEPFNDSRALGNNAGAETTHAMFYSTKKGVDMFADPEFIDANILAAPGIVNEGITSHMLNICEERGDALAIIDPRGGYKPSSEESGKEQDRITTGEGLGGVSKHVQEVSDNLDNRNLNSSYGAAYYPWVRISDTITGRGVWAPPSIAAIGAMSFSENRSALWFAPAGFNRGGLSDGAAGIPVTNVRSRLTSTERDYMYQRNLNPIATFPNEGIVIFGQKTLQVVPSALDRINVRRLMIFVKKEISRIASTLLFDQNVEQTWARFTGQVGPFLTAIKNNFGLDDFRVILDETTTTPDLIDRNTIYAKIFLKPTKAVEFFAIDFVITNAGASFED